MSKKMKELSRTQKQTRQNLIDAFMRIYTEKPIEQIGIAEIAATAGYSRSTFYLYFPDIYALAEAARDDLIAEIREKIGMLIAKNAGGDIGGLLTELGALGEAYADRLFLFSNEPAFRETFTNLLSPVFSLRSGLDPGSKEYRFAVSLIVSTIFSNIDFWRRNAEDYTLVEIIGMAQRILLPGLRVFAKID